MFIIKIYCLIPLFHVQKCTYNWYYVFISPGFEVHAMIQMNAPKFQICVEFMVIVWTHQVTLSAAAIVVSRLMMLERWQEICNDCEITPKNIVLIYYLFSWQCNKLYIPPYRWYSCTYKNMLPISCHNYCSYEDMYRHWRMQGSIFILSLKQCK